MKRLLVALVLLLLTSIAWAQSPVTATLQTAATTGNGTVLTTVGFTLVGLQITENAAGDRVVNFEGSTDATNFVALSCRNVATLAVATTSSASSVYTCSLAGLKSFRARVSGGTTGTVTVTALMLSNAAANVSSTSVAGGAGSVGASGTVQLSDGAAGFLASNITNSGGLTGFGVAPSTLIHAKGASPEVRLSSSSAGQSLWYSLYDNDATLQARFLSQGGQTYLVNDGGSQFNIYGLANVNTVFWTNGLTRMTISNIGLTTIDSLAATGSATGKTVVCADSGGTLYRSSSGVACAN